MTLILYKNTLTKTKTSIKKTKNEDATDLFFEKQFFHRLKHIYTTKLTSSPILCRSEEVSVRSKLYRSEEISILRIFDYVDLYEILHPLNWLC